MIIMKQPNGTLKINLKTYFKPSSVLSEFKGIRNLMVITGKGTGKSSDARKLIKLGIEKPDELLKYIGNTKIDIKNGIRFAGIRNTERSLKKAILTFKGAFTEKEGYKVNDNGVFYKDDEKPKVLFVNLNAPSNAADQNLGIRIVFYDEFNSFESESKIVQEKEAIKDFAHVFTEVIQGITRPYIDDVPYIIMLANPRTTPDENDLYELFEVNGDGSKCNVKTQIIKNSKYKFMGIGTGPFKIKDMEFSIGKIKNVGMDYPSYNEQDKRIFGYKDFKKLLKGIEPGGMTYKGTDMECYIVNLGSEKDPNYILYIRELRNYTDSKCSFFECGEGTDKLRLNQVFTNTGHFSNIKQYGKLSKIYFSTNGAKEIVKELAQKVIRTLPTIYK